MGAGSFLTELGMGSNFLKLDSTYSLMIATEWDSQQWVYIYLFSDAAANQKGFGAYVPGVGSQKFEMTLAPAFDLTAYEGSYGMRLGTRINGAKNTHFIGKMLHFKGTAIHTSSTETL